MLDTKLLHSITNDFYLCTHIPIKVITLDNMVINSSGYDNELEKIFEANFSFEEFQKHIISIDKLKPTTFTCKHNIKFTLCSFCPAHSGFGYFVLGPYTSEILNVPNVIHKPSSCIPHIIALLYNIRKDFLLIKPPEENKDMPYSRYIKKSIFFINANYANPIELKNIADYVGINKSYFCTLFKQETRKTCSQYLNEVRIEKSKELLKKNNTSILDVAFAVGFNNQNYFNMTFKKLTKLTPLQFRNECN